MCVYNNTCVCVRVWNARRHSLHVGRAVFLLGITRKHDDFNINSCFLCLSQYMYHTSLDCLYMYHTGIDCLYMYHTSIETVCTCIIQVSTYFMYMFRTCIIQVERFESRLASAPIVCMDGNIPVETLQYICDVCHRNNVPGFFPLSLLFPPPPLPFFSFLGAH